MSSLPNFGGVGAEPHGDPMGGGGPLHVVRARAVAGQVVRVVFDQEPLHQGASGSADALNPSNYLFSIIDGTGQPILAVGVDQGMIIGPTVAVRAGAERAFDVHTDRQLVKGLTYRMKAIRIQSRAGYLNPLTSGDLAGPATADFVGVVPLHVVAPPARRLDNVDLANAPIDGIFSITNAGDIDIQTGRQSFRKRIIRRIATSKNAFSWLPGYGCTLRLKEEMKTNLLQDAKADLLLQIQREPETKTVVGTLTILDVGMLSIRLGITTKEGAFMEIETLHRQDGSIDFLP